MTVLAAARVVTGEVVHRPGWVAYDERRILAVGPGVPPHVDRDLGDTTVVPGFVDQHVHGGGGGAVDGDAASVLRAVTTHRRHGTTAMLASLVSAGPADLHRSVSLLADLHRDGLIAGVHLEGPWISDRQGGAHDHGQLRDADAGEIDRLLRAGRGSIAMVTLAPERTGGLRAIRQLGDAGVVAAIGHTDADFELTARAVGLGARVGTHLFNAMRPLRHRDPGPVAALLEDPRVTVELIADRVHLHPAVYRHVTRTVGEHRVALVTDAMSAATLGDGEHLLGRVPVVVQDGVARVAATGAIAGSTATMDTLFRHAVADGPPGDDPGDDPVADEDAALLRAVRQTSLTPARTLGLAGRAGLRPGGRPDLVVLDRDLRVVEVLTGA